MQVLWATMLLQMKNSFSRATFKFVVLFQPIFMAIITYMVYKDSGIPSYLSYVILGSGIMSLWSSIIFSSAGDIERERFMGNLEILGITTTPFTKIMYGKILGNTVLGVGSMLITFLWVTFVYGERLVIHHPMVFFVGLMLMILSFMSLAMILAAFFTLSRNSRALMNCLEYPIYILTGMVFPLSLVPEFLKPLSWILSPTWAIQILNMAIEGFRSFQEILLPISVMIGLCVIYYILGEVIFKHIEKQTRMSGTQGVY